MTDPQPSPIDVSREGRHARERGDRRSANPYPDGSQEHAIWDRGYTMADGDAVPPDDGGKGQE